MANWVPKWAKSSFPASSRLVVLSRFILSLFLFFILFIADWFTPLGSTIWFFYVFPLFLLAPVSKPLHLILYCLASLVLIAAGFFLSPEVPRISMFIPLINRLFGALAIIIFTFVLLKRRQAEQNLRQANEELERRVQERTGELLLLSTSLEDERKRLETVLTHIPAGVIIAEAASGQIIYANQQVERIWRRPFASVSVGNAGTEYQGYYPDGRAYRPSDWPIARSLTKGEEVSSEEIHIIRGDGTPGILSVSSTPIRDHDNHITAAVSILSDISEHKKMEEEILHLAHHDELTGLPNRRLFVDIIQFEIAKAHRKHHKFAVLFLDLDRFKEVNDTLGHKAGDSLLKQVAVQLRNSLRETDALARIGGDEFNIILSEITRVEDIPTVVDKIMASLQKPFLVDSHELHITTSIGISIYPDDSTDQETLFRYADIALYQAKALERNTYQFYNPTINLRTIEKLKIENYLRYTLERGELLVYYQPQFDLKTGEQVYAEALVRWQHPELGLLDPEHFMSTAEDTGFITNIDEWVIVTACSQFNAWLKEGLHPPCLTVNISAKEFKNPQLQSTIRRILDESGLEPSCLEVEVAETIAMQNIDYTVSSFQALAATGIRISLDHFGLGYSSLNLLKQLPLNRLKIDQVFIKEIATNPDDQAIVRAITAMAHNLQFKVVVEGVETTEQLNYLRASGCDQAQGNLLSTPLPTDRFKALLMATMTR